MKKFIILLAVLFNFTLFANAATTSTAPTNPACNPAQVKPVKADTSLATAFSIAPEIVAVGQLTTFQIVSQGTNNTSVRIDIPDGMELTDYNPKTIAGIVIKPQAKAVEWQNNGGKIPTDTYSIILKPAKWTKNAWKEVSYAASSDLGTGYGNNSYFSYYNKIQPEINIDEKNQTPQTSKDVVRQIIVKAVPDVKINLSIDKGSLGSTISQSTGQKISQTANANGEVIAFVFAKEGDKINLSASSPDSCTATVTSQSFTIGKSGVANTSVDYSWIYWLIGAGLIILAMTLIIWLMRRKNTEKQIDNTNNISSDDIPPTNPPDNLSGQ